MEVKVKLFSSLRNYDTKKTPIGETIHCTIQSGSKIRDIIQMLHIPDNEVAIILVNHVHESMDFIIEEEGLTISLFPVSGGG